MPSNTNPIFTKNGAFNGVLITAANTNSNGVGTIGTDLFKAFTADATNGSFISRVRFMLCATTAGTATAATVFRVYVSSLTSGATTGGTNCWLIGELSVVSQTADSATAATSPLEFGVGFAIPASYTILVSSHAAPAANTMFSACVVAGDY